jgi:hypothetical protein
MNLLELNFISNFQTKPIDLLSKKSADGNERVRVGNLLIIIQQSPNLHTAAVKFYLRVSPDATRHKQPYLQPMQIRGLIEKER